MSETCDRCRSVGSDRRTLWHACFYAMDELNLPFDQASIHGVCCAKVGEKTLPMLRATLPVWAAPSGEAEHHQFFTLRVCKRCRGEWLEAIRNWFLAVPQGADHDADDYDPVASTVGSGIFVRENGAIREVTIEEWNSRQTPEA